MDSHNPAASDDDDAHGPEHDAEHNAEHVDATAGDELRAEGLILERAIGGWRADLPFATSSRTDVSLPVSLLRSMSASWSLTIELMTLSA